MGNENRSSELGQRCRRIRMAKGFSQLELADRAGTTPQNISKFERDGISDIYWIDKLSECLGQSLLLDEVDEEGNVGEMGKEILFRLVEAHGRLEIEDLLEFLYGINMERISNEIFKLERIGLLVREQYKDWHDTEKDEVFITAKGIITIKNMDLNASLAETIFDELAETHSYEELLNDKFWIERYDSYQELIDNNECEKILKGFKYQFGWPPEFRAHDRTKTPYRMNYIEWLKKNYEIHDVDSNTREDNMAIPCNGIYYDILYRMAFGLTNKYLMDHYISDDEEEAYEKVEKILIESEEQDSVIRNAKEAFDSSLYWLNKNTRTTLEDTKAFIDEQLQEILNELGMTKEEWFELVRTNTVDSIECSEILKSKISRLLEFWEATDFTVEGLVMADPEYEYGKRRPTGSSEYPTDWFSYEEIKAFIEENFGPAQTEEEHQIDALLKKINEEMADTVKEYYQFPREWEENGLADMIRKSYGM